MVLEQQKIIVVAVSHHGALAQQQLLRRVRRRLHLQHFLLRELLEIRPTEFTRQHECRGHDRAGIAGMRLDDLAGPFRIEQVGIALWRVFRLHQIAVVANGFDPAA